MFEEKQEHIKKTNQKINDPKPLKQIAGDNIELDDKKLDRKLAKKWLIHMFSLIEIYIKVSELM